MAGKIVLLPIDATPEQIAQRLFCLYYIKSKNKT